MKNANEPKRVVPLKDKIDKKLTEIRKLISDADPKALQALPKSIKDIFDI